MMCRCMLGSSSTTAGCGHGSRVLWQAELPSLYARMVAPVPRSNIRFWSRLWDNYTEIKAETSAQRMVQGNLLFGEKLWG